MTAVAFRFPNVSCSQCGGDFGPGDSGFSSCNEHQRQPADLERKADQAIQRGPQIAKSMGASLPVKLIKPADDGGPAFPFIEPPTECNVSEGMSLRDHFAGLAMSGLLAAGREAQYGDNSVVDLATWSYRIADQMIAARAAS